MRASTDDREREREREREMGEMERQTDRWKETERCFDETRNCCMMHCDYSVWPASKNDG